MFTGIVEERGVVIEVNASGDESERSATVRIRGPLVVSDAQLGDSIAVNGVCLTLVEHDKDSFTVDVMRETLVRTAGFSVGAEVNLERAVTAGTRLGGHIVQGHVDGVGTVFSRRHTPEWDIVHVSASESVGRYLVPKGSITIDGVSLTVVDVQDRDSGDCLFSVSLIPTTLGMTTLGSAQPGDRVNLEADVIAKYVERLVSRSAAGEERA